MRKTSFPHITAEARGRLAVIFEERGIGIYRPTESLAEHERRVRNIEISMKGCPGRPLNTMIRPQNLRTIGKLDYVKGAPTFMHGGE